MVAISTMKRLSGGRCSSSRLFREFEQQRRLRKRHLKNVFTLLQTLSRLFYPFKCWWIFLELNSKGLYQSSVKEKRIVALCSSTKREVRQFHVEVLQRRQRYVQRNRDERAKFLFCLLNVLLFCRSCCRRPCLSPLIFLSPLYYHPYVNEVLKMTFLLS